MAVVSGKCCIKWSGSRSPTGLCGAENSPSCLWAHSHPFDWYVSLYLILKKKCFTWGGYRSSQSTCINHLYATLMITNKGETAACGSSIFCRMTGRGNHLLPSIGCPLPVIKAHVQRCRPATSLHTLFTLQQQFWRETSHLGVWTTPRRWLNTARLQDR